MPRIEQPVVVPNYALTDALSWISKFAHAWKAIEPAPATLSIDGFIIWGPVLYEQHSAEDPVQLAARLFGSSGPYFRYLYPGAAAAANQG